MSHAGSVADLRSQFETSPDVRTPEQLSSLIHSESRGRALRFSTGEHPGFLKAGGEAGTRRSASPPLPQIGPKPPRHVEKDKHVNGVKHVSISVTASELENELREKVMKQAQLIESLESEKEEMEKEFEEKLDQFKKEAKDSCKRLNAYHSRVDKYERTAKARRVCRTLLDSMAVPFMHIHTCIVLCLQVGEFRLLHVHIRYTQLCHVSWMWLNI